jgi:hypothetical protein
MDRLRSTARMSTCAAALLLAGAAVAQPRQIFHVSADKGLVADQADGQAAPTFSDKVSIVPNGAFGGAIHADDDQVLAWSAPGNIYAQRGTLSFFWRAREPLGKTAFPIYRVGYSDHSSWDMVFLRVDWNGHGFDAFVTDTNLARTRVSWTTPKPIAADAWTHIAFTWDETEGVRLYIDGVEVAAKKVQARYDAGLDQMGPHSRIISPQQVQSRYQMMRGGDIDEIRVFDAALDGAGVARLTRNAAPVAAASPERSAWLARYGWTAKSPPYLAAPATRIRKVEFADARDVKARMAGAIDGVRETTWPGVYNRSRLPGRHDYFELPDWNLYVEGGKAVTFSLPDEPWNRLQVTGAADGKFTWSDGAKQDGLGPRPIGIERNLYDLPTRRGGKLRFDNRLPETPIQEISAYDVGAGSEPLGAPTLTYRIQSKADVGYAGLETLNRFIAGRYPAGERSTVVALPNGVAGAPAKAPAATAGRLPIVHVLIPSNLLNDQAGGPVAKASQTAGWDNIDAGLDGLAIDLPALNAKPAADGLIPLNIRIKDPLRPDRDLLDIDVSVKPGEARTLWLDTRDRILPAGHGIYLTLASAAPDFSGEMLDGAAVRLVFKPRADARAEHLADRITQIRDEQAWNVEEHPNDPKLARYARVVDEVQDVLRVDPDNLVARSYWADMNPGQPWPAFTQPTPPAGAPLWAFRQLEDLKQVHKFVGWWINNRQSDYGDFGGGISDDDDLTQQWPGLAMMGVEPAKITASLSALVEAVDRNGMITNGLGTIQTDELHSYEEGINARSEAMYLQFGDPRTVERLMETAKAYSRIIQTNKAGHTHIVSNLFSGTDVVREGVWEWSKPHSHLILHPGVLLVDFNNNAATRKLVLDLADSYLAHGKEDGKGGWTFPSEINWSTDADRGGSLAKNPDVTSPLQLFWAAYRWTGDAKYLRPLESRIAENDLGVIKALNDNLIDFLKKRDTWGPRLVEDANAPGADNYDLYAAWQITGDKRYLETLYGAEIQTGAQRMDMVTTGEWWTDRVELFSDLLQRSRLGGMALRRNQIVPGATVGWTFDRDENAEKVAILMPGATPTRFKVIGYNISDAEIRAQMTGWHVAPGRWKVTSGVDRDGDDKIDGEGAAQIIDFERSVATPLSFAPHVATIYLFELDKRGVSIRDRADVGIGAYDIKRERATMAVMIHGLGSLPSGAGVVELKDAAGQVVGSAPFPAMAAPNDLTPKTVRARLKIPAGFKSAGARVSVRLVEAGPEITQLNNSVVLP